MKKRRCLLISAAFLCVSFMPVLNLSAQDKCRVLNDALLEEYSGGCRKGLAHGTGEAKGIDIYKGEFKKGLPHGKGIYLWKNGNSYEGEFKEGMKDGKGRLVFRNENQEDSILAGYWLKDEYKGLTLMGYEIVTKSSNISYLVVRHRASRPNTIEISGIDRAVDLNGNQNFYPFDNKYDNVEYPITVKLSGKSTKPESIADLDFEIFFEKPGYWTVTIESD
jgi:hypothetical protein